MYEEWEEVKLMSGSIVWKKFDSLIRAGVAPPNLPSY